MPSVPSCLVLDVRLPGPSGFELHAELTKALSNTFAGIAPAGVTAFIAAQMIGMLASVMLTASARSPDWVKSGKAQPEQMFSASRTTGDIKTNTAALLVKVGTMGYLTGQLMSGMVSAGSSTVMTLSTRPKLPSTTAARQLFHRQRRDTGHPDIRSAPPPIRFCRKEGLPR